MDSSQTSQDGASSDSDLNNLKNVASKIEEENKKTQSLLKEIQDAMDIMKSQGQEGATGVDNYGGGRGRGNSNVRGALDGFKGRHRGRGSYNNNVGNQGNKTTGAQNQNETSSNGNANQPINPGQNNQRGRGPFFFPCEKNGADFNHWPFQHNQLSQILSDWHAHQNATGHQNQSQNLHRSCT